MKDRIKSQITELTRNNNVAKAKAWWRSLSKTEQAVAIGILVALGIGITYYASTVGTVQLVAYNGALYMVEISAAQALWSSAVAGTLSGLTAGIIKYKW